MTPVAYWLVAEVGIAIFAISLPTTFHLCKRAHHFGLQALISRQDYSLPTNCESRWSNVPRILNHRQTTNDRFIPSNRTPANTATLVAAPRKLEEQEIGVEKTLVSRPRATLAHEDVKVSYRSIG